MVASRRAHAQDEWWGTCCERATILHAAKQAGHYDVPVGAAVAAAVRSSCSELSCLILGAPVDGIPAGPCVLQRTQAARASLEVDDLMPASSGVVRAEDSQMAVSSNAHLEVDCAAGPVDVAAHPGVSV